MGSLSRILEARGRLSYNSTAGVVVAARLEEA
jgi:hypothetical protein